MATPAGPTPDLVFGTLFAYQRTAALKTGIALEVFTAIDEGAATAADIAKRSNASERGVRILCDYLTICGLLTKDGARYGLTADSAFFLSKKSQAYLGTTCDFLTSPDIMRNFDDLTATVRNGTVAPQGNTVAGHEQSHWVLFARAMMPMMMPAAMGIADILNIGAAGPVKILDIAAGHGAFGIVLAARNPDAQVVAVDWPGVLSVASENADKMGVAHRYRTLPGDAFSVDYGAGYDIALLTNFLHHYDAPTCVTLLKKVAAALKPGGRAVILEFVPNEDRVTPPMAASFSLTMLAGTPAGDAYTLSQLTQMAADAGFSGGCSAHPLPMPETVVVATK
ncbi:MAG TPA: class I SAM-dependent methyltransferase [Vicinamibacterales bacterium]|jgi:SAM-dependent methyltransferase|nr:class I SAM-dependent methyltransferase [Vicinamibacterales bacterium]